MAISAMSVVSWGMWQYCMGVASSPPNPLQEPAHVWIVKIALRRPYTFIVLALLLPLFGVLALQRMAVDIFPRIGVPVLGAVWNYGGLSAEEVATRMITRFERGVTTNVSDIEHLESQSLQGAGIVKLFLHPEANVERSLSLLTSLSQTMTRQMPQGTSPPLIASYDASNVPVLQMAVSSTQRPEQEVSDIVTNLMRNQLATVQGASIPNPYGGKQPQIMVDLDPGALAARGLSPSDVSAALGLQNLILPAGSQKIGAYEYDIRLNSGTDTVEALNDMPVKALDGGMVFLRDVAHVHDGFEPQQNIVRVDGERAVLVTVLRGVGASTIDIIERVKAMLPRVQATIPEDIKVKLFSDQSLFVSAAVNSVIFEGLIAASLTALLILVFLGSWRSTLIISISIPLSILASIIVLAALGDTINIMTLSGFALAIGILVDDATVTIENINWHLEQGKDIETAIMDGAQQIVLPALASVLCICVVFVPMFFLSGVAGFLFAPMAKAVIFAMIASFLLSRTLVPTLAKFWLRAHPPGGHAASTQTARPGAFARLRAQLDAAYERLHSAYHGLLERALASRRVFPLAFSACVLASLPLAFALGTDFFPSVDAGQIKLHLRARSGLRIEETAALVEQIEASMRRVIPAAEITTLADNIGLANSSIAMLSSNSAATGAADADVLITLREGHRPTAEYIAELRTALPREFPGVEFAFIPADIVTQILNFGLPAPFDVQVIGNNLEGNREVARRLLERMRAIPGLVDVRQQQTFDKPQLMVNVDRVRAQEIGLTLRDVAQDMLISLSGSQQTAPVYWLNPRSGTSYSVVTQTPQHRLSSLDGLRGLPLGANESQAPRTLGQVATVSYGTGQNVVSHYNVQPVLDLFGSVQGRDFGGVTRDVRKAVAEVSKDLPRGTRIEIRGQVETMDSSFRGLYGGLALAILLVYLLLVITFQSWTDALIIVAALPAALAGIVWMLFLTFTTLSVPALTGAIMCMGVATANSILVISFARERLAQGSKAVQAVLEAGHARFRPVLMTALAMIVGMSPMALGFGEGGEQNAPLGRAVIGGLLFATVATLFFVPSVFAWLHTRRQRTAGIS
jgi:CzcA family heavy metal efflux pump